MTAPETRAAWQIEQGKKCACRGLDEYCPCQNALSTTPARAEAQDEGEAGSDAVSHHAKTDADPVVSMLRDVAERLERTEPDLLGARVGVQAVRLAVSSRLLAHPSPTPAADADRVREAIRELIDADKELAEAINFAEPTANNNALTTAEYRARAARNQAEEALAALKSTAAKEGEKS